MKALITRKLGMTSVIGEDGASFGVTLLSVSPNVVTQIKTDEKDGYHAVQLGSEEEKNAGKSMIGHFKVAGKTPKLVNEFRILDDESNELSVGQSFEADVFSIGDIVKVTGVSKGKGWAGTIKRYNFKRGRKTHGGRSYRRPGSIGSMYPQKIFKGKRMAGHMGHEQVSIKNLKVAIVDKELGVIGLAGAVPGPKKGVILVRGTQ